MTITLVDPGVIVEVRTVSTAIAGVLGELADHVYGLMGNGNAQIVSTVTTSGTGYTSLRHEVSVVTAADAHYRASGRIAAATTTYGPGFTNTLTGLVEADKAGIPLVLVAGDAPSSPRRADIAQVDVLNSLGVQFVTAGPDNAAFVTREAFARAQLESRPIVVLVPYDISEAICGDNVRSASPSWARQLAPQPTATPEEVTAIARRLKAAKRPLLLAGRGVVLAGAERLFEEVGDRLGAMFATSVMAMGVTRSPWNLGVAGGFTRAHRLPLFRDADIVLVVGASMNTFQMRYGSLFSANVEVIRIDTKVEHDSIGEHISADLHAFLGALARELPASTPEVTWRSVAPHVSLPAFHDTHPVEDDREFGDDGRLNPRMVVAELDKMLPIHRSVVVDAGHFFGWPVMHLNITDPSGFVAVGSATSCIGLGSGAATGVAVARPERFTTFFMGDGGGLMGLADLESFIRSTRRGAIIVINDSAYGAELHQYKTRGLDDTAMLIDDVDFAAIGRALGAAGTRVHTLADLEPFREWLATEQDGVYVLDVTVSQQIIAEFITEGVVLQPRS